MSNSLATTGILGGSVGLATDGMLGMLFSLDPPWEQPATPVLAGGTIGRPITHAGPGRWLLELDLGGQRWRIADRACTPTSRNRNGTLPFVAGLSDLSWQVDSESVSVAVRAGAADTWARQRRTLGPIRGRPFILRYWYENQVLEDAFVALQGVIESASFGSPSDPYTLQLSCERNLAALSRPMIPPLARVDDSTWPSLLSTNEIVGAIYPLVIGHPGGLVRPATPGLFIEYTLECWLIIAGHRVEATSVTVYNITAGDVEVLPVEHAEDGLGRTVARVDLIATTITRDPTHEYAIGWDRSSGGGVLRGAAAVAGLGDLLIWGASSFSSAVHDWGEMEARRQALNRFRIDTVVNEPITWNDWLESNVLGLFELEMVEGRHGVYYQERRHTTDRRLVRGRLVTGTAGGGYRVERAAAIEEDSSDIYNAITLDYQPFAASHEQFAETITVAGVTGWSGIETDPMVEDVVHRDPRCEYSQRLFGPRPLVLQTAISDDRATLLAIAQTKAARHALPKLLTAYQGGRDLLDFRKWDVVEVEDTSPGAYFQGDLGIVVGITMVDASTVQLDIAIDTDPIKSPTVRSS